MPGLQFFKLLGSGAANGFGLWPNLRPLRLYGACGTMRPRQTPFMRRTRCGQHYQQRSAEQWTLQLAPLKAHGLWDGKAPFD